MKIRKHKCPYLVNQRYCGHKRDLKLRKEKKIDCIYNKCEDCPLWQHSLSDAERLILTPITPSSKLNHIDSEQ